LIVQHLLSMRGGDNAGPRLGPCRLLGPTAPGPLPDDVMIRP
jgi:hypothetical protein